RVAVLRVVVTIRGGEFRQYLEPVIADAHGVSAAALGDQQELGIEGIAEPVAVRLDGRLSLEPLRDAGPAVGALQARPGTVECRQPGKDVDGAVLASGVA